MSGESQILKLFMGADYQHVQAYGLLIDSIENPKQVDCLNSTQSNVSVTRHVFLDDFAKLF